MVERLERPWWQTSLIAALAAVVVVALAFVLPTGGALLLGLGALVFVLVLVRNPAYWRRRLAGTCVGVAVTLALTPTLSGVLDLGAVGVLLLDGGSAWLLTVLFLAAAGWFASLESRRERPALPDAGDRPPRTLHVGEGGRADFTAHEDMVLRSKTETHEYHGPVYNMADDRRLVDAREHGVDLPSYLRTLLEDVDHIDIRGISSKEAMREPIENLYTPLRSRDPDAALREGRRKPARPEEVKEQRVELPELLRRHQRLLLEGQPGAGKTTFLKLVVCMLARDVHEPRGPGELPWRTQHLGLPADEAPPIPAFVRLSALVSALRDDPEHKQPDDRAWLLDLLAHRTRPADSGDDRGHDHRRKQWDQWLQRGAAVLLLDGLDEVASDVLRERVFKIVRNACKKWAACRVVVTSRPIKTAAMTAAPLRFHKAVIDDFGEQEIQRFVQQWSAALYAGASGKAGDNTRSLSEKIAGRKELRELARNPVMLTCLCVIHYNEGGELPNGRARVYRAIVHWMLRSRDTQRAALGYSTELAENALERLALAMMDATGPQGQKLGKIAAIDFGDAAAAIQDEVRRYLSNDGDPLRRAKEWLRTECELSHLIEEVEGNQLKFWHLTMQEFLAAWAIAGRSDWWPEIERRLEDPQWRESLELFPGCLYERNGRDRVDDLVRRILERGEHEGLLAEARTVAALGCVLAPMSAYQYREDPDLIARRTAMAGRVMAMLSREGAAEVPVAIRIAAAEVIGRWGDPRLAEDVDNFVAVPGTDVKLGRYPVTVVEYARFVDEEGYEDPRWWGEDGEAWKQEWHTGQREPWSWLVQLEQVGHRRGRLTPDRESADRARHASHQRAPGLRQGRRSGVDGQRDEEA